MCFVVCLVFWLRSVAEYPLNPSRIQRGISDVSYIYRARDLFWTICPKCKQNVFSSRNSWMKALCCKFLLNSRGCVSVASLFTEKNASYVAHKIDSLYMLRFSNRLFPNNVTFWIWIEDGRCETSNTYGLLDYNLSVVLAITLNYSQKINIMLCPKPGIFDRTRDWRDYSPW